MEMVDRILLQQLSIKSGWKHFKVFAIPNNQSSPTRDERVYASCVRISIIYRSTLFSWTMLGY